MQLFNILVLWCLVFIILVVAPIQRKYKLVIAVLCLAMTRKMVRIISYIVLYVPRILNGKPKEYRTLVQSVFTKCFTLRHNFRQLPTKPTIFLANYPITILEYTIPSLLPLPVCFLTSQRAEKALKLVYSKEEYLVFNDGKKKNFEYLKECIQERVKTSSMYVYVEDQSQRIHDFHVGNMRKGMFYIAKELGVTITPIAIDGVLLQNGMIPDQ
jgi:hypothetical protein